MSTNNGHKNNGKPAKRKKPTGSRTGRKSLLTPETQEKICNAIAQGDWEKNAALNAGVGVSTLEGWKVKGAEQEDSIYSAFVEALKNAHERNKGRLLKIVDEKAVEGDWKAAMTSLERRYRSEFGRNEVSGPVKVEHGLSPWLQAALENAQSRQLAPMDYDREIVVPDSEAEDA